MGARTVKLPDPVESVAAITRMREGGSERKGFVSLDRNERVGPLPDWFVEELRRELASDLLTSYPATDELHAELAASLHVPPGQVLVTPGTDPTLRSLCQAYVRSGDTIAMLDPSYAMYDVYARMFGATAVKAGFDAGLEPDIETLLAAVSGGARLAFVANPNQPTGTVLDLAVLRELLALAEASGTVIVLDEAYGFFGGPDTLPLVRESPNVVLARSFSKAGFAGIRVGYVAGGEEIVRTLVKVRSAADTNALAIACARKLVAHPEVARDYAEAVAQGRELLAERGRALGLDPLPTHGNFMSLRVGSRERGEALVAAVRERGYLIRGPYPQPPLHESIRVTLGPPEVMTAFADALAEAVAGVS